MSGPSRLRLDPESAFAGHGAKTGLAGKSARSAAVALSSQAVRLGITVAGTAIMSRLLTPQDFGLVAMVAVIVAFAQVFRDAGLGTPTIQSPEITRPQISNLFWVNMAVLVALGAALGITSPLTARFYHEPRLVAIVVALAGAFVLNGLSAIHEALLKRSLYFPSLGTSQVVAQALGLAAMVTAALLGWGYWSLVAGTFVTSIVSTVLVFAFCPWVPSAPRRGVGARTMLESGLHLTGFNLVNYFAKNADYISIGRVLGAVQLGLYSKAFQISMLPMSQIRVPVSDVALPVLSALTHETERYRRYFEMIVRALAAIAFPIGAFFALEGELLVRIVLGPQWTGAVPSFRILSVGGAVQSVVAICSLTMMSHGYTRRYLNLGVASAAITVTAILIGLRWGIVGVAWGYTLSSVVLYGVTAAVAFKGTPVTAGGFVRATALPFAVTLCATAAGGFVMFWAPFTMLGSGLAVTAVFSAVYVGLVFASRGLRETVSQLLRSIRSREVAGQVKSA